MSLGYTKHLAAEAVNYLHDTRYTPTYWGENNGVVKHCDFPEYPIGSQRAKALTIKEPYVLKKAAENHYYPFDRRQCGPAAVELILRAMKVTTEDFKRIQANLDNWGIDNPDK